MVVLQLEYGLHQLVHLLVVHQHQTQPIVVNDEMALVLPTLQQHSLVLQYLLQTVHELVEDLP